MIRQALLFSTAAAAVLILSACADQHDVTSNAGEELKKTSGMTPTGSEFNRTLFSEYLQLSRAEFNQGDYPDSDTYAVRARSAGQGMMVEPFTVAERKIPADQTSDATSYRGRLVKALGSGGRERLPHDAARAQAMYDCWLEQIGEGHSKGPQASDAAACRTNFLAALQKLETPLPERYMIYFDTNKATLTDKGRSEVARIVARARAINASNITVEGHTDRVGSDAYNLRLSQKRDDAVHNAIHLAGLNAAITSEAYGETRPAKPTPDGVAEASNRRVDVTIYPPATAPLPTVALPPTVSGTSAPRVCPDGLTYSERIGVCVAQ